MQITKEIWLYSNRHVFAMDAACKIMYQLKLLSRNFGTYCGLILFLVYMIFFYFQTHYHTLPYPETKEKKIFHQGQN